MSQESALTPEELEAMDRNIGTAEQQPSPSQREQEPAIEEMAARSQEPEAKS